MSKVTKILTILLLVGCSAKQPPVVPDFGPEDGDGKADSATRPSITIRIAFDAPAEVPLGDGGVNWRAFQFTGLKGQIVDGYAQGLGDTDTVLYLYKISRITGRPYGKPVAYNDDTDHDGWSFRKQAFNGYSSSFAG